MNAGKGRTETEWPLPKAVRSDLIVRSGPGASFLLGQRVSLTGRAALPTRRETAP